MAYSTISKPSLYFNTKLYTGNGSTQSITGVGFQPDWVWIKSRGYAEDHQLTDAVRGVTKSIQSNLTTAESTFADGLTAFGTDGFSLGSKSDFNYNNDNLVAWNWKANGAGSANTDGTINSTVSANTTAGFSIVSWTGTGANATVGHGLGSTPKMIIAKCLDNAKHWLVFHNSLDTNKNLYLNLTNAEDTPSPEIYRKGSFTNNVFAIGAHDRINASSQSMIAYCFAEKTGYSKFGSYTGNGNANGSFIYTGFKPAWIMVKNTGVSCNWVMFDNKRSGFNVDNDEMSPNTNGGDNDGQTYQYVDLLSNGFKWREASNNKNTSGDNFIYMASAEEPLVANVGQGIPATAR